MHDDQIEITEATLDALLASGAPELAALPRRPLPLRGTQNRMIRLGEALVLRLPLIPAAGPALEAEARLLPLLSNLPLAAPRPRHIGAGIPGFPHPWLVQDWLPGSDAASAPPTDRQAAARSLAAFLTALRRLDPSAFPEARRGGPVAVRRDEFHAALVRCDGLIDTARAAAQFDAACAAPPWHGPSIPLHADLIPANLLTRDGTLSAVIDWGSASRGDPAWDLTPAWFLLDAATRPLFRKLTRADDATWTRARGHVVAQSVIALPYYLNSNPAMTALARRGLAEALPEPL